MKQHRKTSSAIAKSIIDVRGMKTILDSELAALFSVATKRLNEQVKRNRRKFGPLYAFQLTQAEFSVLRSQSATSKDGRGGRRYRPWVFTDYGVVMAATVLDTPKAIKASKLVVSVFVELKRQLTSLPSRDSDAEKNFRAAMAHVQNDGLQKVAGVWGGMAGRLQLALQQLLDTVVDHKRQTTVRQEAQDLISESIHNLKDRLKKTGIENEEIAARATKLLAEAEKEKAVAAKTRAEADQIEFSVLVRKLRLLMEADLAITQQRPGAFLEVLRDLG